MIDRLMTVNILFRIYSILQIFMMKINTQKLILKDLESLLKIK